MSENVFTAGGASDFGQLGFSEEQAELLDVATNFCRDKSPIERVRALMTSDEGYDEKVWGEIVDLGWLGVAIPEAYGGVGLSLAEVTPLMEQIGVAMLASPFMSSTVAAQAILAGGTEVQKEKYLPAIVGGEIATLALMEEQGAWDLTNIEATASAGDPATLSGKKRLVCDAAQAKWIIISVLLNNTPALAVLEREALPEGALRRETVIDETKRCYSLNLDDVSIQQADLLDPGKSSAALKHIAQVQYLLSAAECCGGAKAVIDYTVDYLKTRKQFGKLIGSFQALKHPAVDAFVDYEKTRSHLYAAAHCFGDQGTGEIATRMARAMADKTLSYASDRSIQFHGGFGFTYDCDAQLYRRRAAWHAALYGDAAHHKQRLASLLL